MTGVKQQEADYHDIVEVDPSGRYGRCNEILGKGASKTVYRAFDEYEGIEVAWNQVKLYDFLQSAHNLERLYCEIHLLKTLKHKNIMKFYTSWVDTSKRSLNFITEMFTSGTLRQYRQRHRRINKRAVKHWCRQILKGLVYLHSRDPPVIHRDLKCDNIFINGNQGEVKIGDLGLAAILRKSKPVHCVGTPEFMAPEVYEEEYDELVDIYSFGMCVLEMVTFEYPYSECTHPAQIYKKVISGTKPEALYKIKDQETRQFVEKCLVKVSDRLPARELLKDPFLHITGLAPAISNGDIVGIRHCNGLLTSGDLSNVLWPEQEFEYSDDEPEIHGMELFYDQEEEHFTNMDISIKGRRKEDGAVFVKLRITDKDGRVRNISFPFDVEVDTALSVATEMVAELDITEYAVTRIAEMIDGEVSNCIPGWKAGLEIDDSLKFSSMNLCRNCAANDSSSSSLLDYSSFKGPGCENYQPFYCSNLECAAMHGRFEEITYQIEGSENSHEGHHLFSSSKMDAQTMIRKKMPDELWDPNMLSENKPHQEVSFCADKHENEIQDELRWLRKYKPHFSELYPSSDRTNLDQKMAEDRRKCSFSCRSLQASKDRGMKSFHLANNRSFHISRGDVNEVTEYEFSCKI